MPLGNNTLLFKIEDINQAKQAIAAAFKASGFKEPRFFTSLPSAGARVSN